MPTFDTPQPVSATVELGVGDLQIVATDRTDTTVEVRPRDSANKADVTAAEQTRVEYRDGRLLIKAPKGWRQYTPRGGGESIDVLVELPTGSQVHFDAGVAAFLSRGRLGECHVKIGVGEIRVEHAVGPVQLKTGAGDIWVGHVAGHADVTSGSGTVRVERVDGTAVVKNSNGDTWIGEITGDLRVSGANGRIAVEHADAAVVAKTAKGDVRIGEVAKGAVLAETAMGRVDLGVRDGVAAWLDLSTGFGTVSSELDATDPPQAGQDAVEVRARSSLGDITIHRVLAGDGHPTTNAHPSPSPHTVGPSQP